MTLPTRAFRMEPDRRDEAFLRGTVHHTMTALAHDSITDLPPTHLVAGMTPPTNRWYSGIAFAEPHAVFPMPYSYLQTESGFTFGLPKVVTSRHSVRGGVLSDVNVNMGATSYRIAATDQVTVTIEFCNEIGRVLGRAVLAEGVPYVSYTAVVAHDIAFSVPFGMSYENLAIFTAADSSYGLVTSGTYRAQRLALKAGQFFSLIALPVIEGDPGPTLRKLAAIASFPIERAEVTARLQADYVATTIRYIAKDNGPVAVVRMPHHGAGAEASMGTYLTVSGTVTLASEKLFTWHTPAVTPSIELDLASLTTAQRVTLAAQVAADLAAEPRMPLDTYYAGKALMRDANLYSLARQLDVAGAVEFRAGLEARFVAWMDPIGADRQDDRYFAYDPDWRGVVGMQASFGADRFNDHHIQYGYFLYVGALLARDNPEFLDRVRLVVDALAWDVAAPIDNPWVPQLRVFDAYKGHSWASGLGDGDDGNRQETPAEALNCWNGLAMWAQVTGNDGFLDAARWMLALETRSALDYWLDLDLEDPVRAGYQHTVVPQVWGGKHEYATWFSSDPAVMLGALILPLSPLSWQLARNPERIRRALEDVVGFFHDYDVHLGDYLLMYKSLASPEDAFAAQDKALAFSEDLIDDANSKSYLLAFTMTAAAGSQMPSGPRG